MGQMENEIDSFGAQSCDTDMYVLKSDEEAVGGKVSRQKLSWRESCLFGHCVFICVSL